MQNQKLKTYNRGLKAEGLAALWLKFKGYKILERRYKTNVGEIDIIARRKKTICFIEVKARTTQVKALESLTATMRGRIERAALTYIGQNNVADYEMRFDLITVSPPFFIHHLDNAWQQAA